MSETGQSSKLPDAKLHPSARLKIYDLPYSALFKDHLANPRCSGELSDATAIAEQTNPVCGDRLRLALRLRDGRIEAARFLAYGCAPTLACGSVLAEMIEGMTSDDAARLTRREILRALGGLPSRKQHAAALAIETLRAALEAGKLEDQS
ncbi:MAG TPA: iron-sulfur cluster assembly scaffold protein [Pyrinomonadaceae bacterium]|jgi:nitrogen fixation NifU-like protein